MGVSKETATAWRGGGRRWFTLNAALRAEARAAIAAKCECESPSYADRYPGWTCGWHSDRGYYERVLDRFVRLYRRRYIAPRRTAGREDETGKGGDDE